MLIDLHSHTWPASDDSVLDPDQLIERSKAAGIDAVCLTEHNTFWDPARVDALSRKHGILVLPGCEVTTDEGHMLVFGLHQYDFGMFHIRRLVAMVSAADGAMVAAHPYRRQMPWYPDKPDQYEDALERAGRREAYKHVAALETENGRGTPQENEFSHRLATRLQLPETAGTDSHALVDIARCATYFESDVKTVDDLIRELKTGRFHPLALKGARA